MGSNVENDGSFVLGEGSEASPEYTACTVRAQDEFSHEGKGCCTRESIFKEGFVDGPDVAFHSSLFWQEPKFCLGHEVRELENDADVRILDAMGCDLFGSRQLKVVAAACGNFGHRYVPAKRSTSWCRRRSDCQL